MKGFFKVLFILFSCFFLFAGSAIAGSTVTPGGWMVSRYIEDLGEIGDWGSLEDTVDIVGGFINRLNAKTQGEIDDFIAAVEYYDKEISIEMAGVCDWYNSYNSYQSAQMSFSEEYANIIKIVNTGHDPDIVVFDGPIRRYCFDSNMNQIHTFQEGIDATLFAAQMWINRFPNIKIYILSNFPNWGWKGGPAYFNLGTPYNTMGYGNYYDILNQMVICANNRGVDIQGWLIDTPYEYAIKTASSNQPSVIANVDFLSRLIDFKAECDSRGVEFNLIYNSREMFTLPLGLDADHDFWSAVVQYFTCFYNYGGTVGNHIVVESWGDTPSRIVPPDNYSLSHLANMLNSLYNALY